jgi:glycosyltransferase involved in cell wall biosynthesis
MVARIGEGRIHFHGRVAHHMIGRWMNACDLFCLPSLDEGTPNVLLEALACRTPVVATDTGGIPEIVSPESGILFPKGDVPALAGALRAALERDWDRDRIVCPASSWEDNARSLAGILQRAASSTSRR